jgi:hypothetical protein
MVVKYLSKMGVMITMLTTGIRTGSVLPGSSGKKMVLKSLSEMGVMLTMGIRMGSVLPRSSG